jgi:hypothetical protein
LQDFFLQDFCVGFIGFLGIVYLFLLETESGYPFSSFPSGSFTNLLLRGEWFPSFFYLPIIPFGAVPVLLVCISQAG